VSEASARRILQAHTTDARGLTRELLVSGVLDRLDEWARASRIASSKGFHHGAREWLEAADMIDRKAAPAVSVDARPTIVVNVPFQLGALAGHSSQQLVPIDVSAAPIDGAAASTHGRLVAGAVPPGSTSGAGAAARPPDPGPD